MFVLVGEGCELDFAVGGKPYVFWAALGLMLYGKVGEMMFMGEYLRAAEEVSSLARYCDEFRWCVGGRAEYLALL